LVISSSFRLFCHVSSPRSCGMLAWPRHLEKWQVAIQSWYRRRQ
jgi:hypothetical protein